jgi:hypothetical protein
MDTRYIFIYMYISFREEDMDTRIENLGLNINRYKGHTPGPLKVFLTYVST